MAQNIAMEALIGEGGPIQQLSSREFEVFRLMAEGKSTEEIGHLLKISQKTVANDCTLIKQKLGVSSSIELIWLAMRHGIIDRQFRLAGKNSRHSPGIAA